MENKKESFEERLARLESLVREVEDGKLPLEETLKRYEEGKKLLSELDEELKAAEKRLAAMRQGADWVSADQLGPVLAWLGS